MFLIILSCVSALMVVSANNVIPVQTYPMYQQNGFINPPTNQPSNIQPYIPNFTAQNQLQKLNISPSSLKQVLLNKLLSGSSAQLVLDPNTQNYDMYSYNYLNNQTPENFITNNVVLRNEHCEDKNNDMNDKISRDSKSSERLNRANKKKIKSKRSRNAKAIEDSQKHTVKDTNKSHKKSKRNRNIQDPSEEGESKNKTTRNRSRKRKEQTTENPVDKNKEKSAKSQRRKKKPKTNENNIKNTEAENQLNDITSKYKENIDLDITQDGRDNENRKTRNSKHEVNDKLISYPSSPQEITNHFLTNLNQLNNPLMSNWFAHYENLYQSLSNQPIIVPESVPKRRRKNKHKKNKKKKNAQNKNSTVTTKSVNSNKFDDVFVTTDLDSNPIVESFKSFETNDRNMKYTSNEIFQDGYSINEFDDKYDPGYYEGYIDDYYPLFTDSAAYTANNKEIILKNLNDHKYYYVTDNIKTTTPKIKQKHQKSSYDISESVPNDFEIFKRTYEEVEKESIRNAYKQNFEKKIEEEIRFQSPPFLESPDFETRKIDKSEILTTQALDDKVGRYVGDKSFSAKTANFNGVKKNGIQPQTKDIETVYAKSKVVAYGPVYISEEDTTTAGAWEDNLTSNIYQNDGTTYVLAKSVGDEEEYK